LELGSWQKIWLVVFFEGASLNHYVIFYWLYLWYGTYASAWEKSEIEALLDRESAEPSEIDEDLSQQTQQAAQEIHR